MKNIFVLLIYMILSTTAEDNGTETVTACEGDVARLLCPEGQMISIVKVFYGRRDRVTCATDGSTDSWESGCYSLNALDVVSSKCHGKLTNCSVIAGHKGHFDPCPNTPKYLTVQYKCLPPATSTNPTVQPTIESKIPSISPSTMTTTTTTTTSRQMTQHTTHFFTTQMESPTSTTNGHNCNGKLKDEDGRCLSGVTTFIRQFEAGRKVSPAEIRHLSTETQNAEHIKELVEFFRHLDTLIKNHSKQLPLSESDKEAVVNIHETVHGIASFLLSDGKMEAWSGHLSAEERRKLSSDIVRALEGTSFVRAAAIGRPFRLLSDFVGLEMHVMNEEEKIKELEFHGVDHPRKRNVITLSAASIRQLHKQDGVARVLFASYSDLHRLLGHCKGDSTSEASNASDRALGRDEHRLLASGHLLASGIISASVNGRSSGVVLVQPVRFSMEHHAEPDNSTEVTCSYWKFPEGSRQGAWLSDGCRVVGGNASHTSCACSHLTNFAVLMAVSGQMDHITDARHAFVLSFVTYFGCIISIISLMASFLVFTFVRSIQCKRNTIHKNVVCCLCISELIFLIGISPTSSKILCSLIAVCLHYLFLCTFMWMLMEGVQLYVMLVQVFVIKVSRALWYYVFSYGTSAIIVIMSAGINFNGYGTPKYCWLTTENGFIWSFVGPVCFIIVMNMIFLSMAVFVMCKHTYFSSAKGMDKDSVTQIGSWVKGLVTLVVLLGLTWTFGVLYVNSGTIAMAYIFTFLNSFQGLFIFIFHCLLNEKVRKTFKRNFRDWSPMPSCLSIRSSLTSSSSARASSSNNNNNACKKRSCSTTVSPINPFGSLYKKIHNRKISTSTNARSSAVLISSQQRTSISFQQSSDGIATGNETSHNNNNNNNNHNSSHYGHHNHHNSSHYGGGGHHNHNNQQNHHNNNNNHHQRHYYDDDDDCDDQHIYSEPTLEDPSAYLDPTLIRLDPDEEMSWSPGYSHIEGSVADTEYLDEIKSKPNYDDADLRPKETKSPGFLCEGIVRGTEPPLSPPPLPSPSRLDVKKYQLRRSPGGPTTPYGRSHSLQEASNLASLPKLVVLGRERVARLPSLPDMS